MTSRRRWYSNNRMNSIFPRKCANAFCFCFLYNILYKAPATYPRIYVSSTDQWLLTFVLLIYKPQSGYNHATYDIELRLQGIKLT